MTGIAERPADRSAEAPQRGGGLGQAVVEALTNEGCRVVIAGRDVDWFTAAAGIGSDRIVPMLADVADAG